MNQQLQQSTKQIVELIIRLGALILLVLYCGEILAPFVLPFLWAIIIAVAVFPLHLSIQKKIGGRKKVSAAIITVGILCFVFIPSGLFVASITDSILALKKQVELGSLHLNQPSTVIKTWPVIGNPLFELLQNFSGSATVIFQKYQSQILEIAKVVLMSIIGSGLGFLQVIFSIVIAGVLLSTNGTVEITEIIFKRMVGARGKEFVQLTSSTIRNVVKGVLGVAVIQSFLAGLGFFMAGVPHAGIWGVITLVLSIIQLGPGLVILPVIGYLYTTGNTVFASFWAVYFVLVMFADNILKPILLGKGAQVPMLVIFLGVIGGFLLSGFIGLFTGAIVLSIGYKLFLVWMHEQVDTPASELQ